METKDNNLDLWNAVKQPSVDFVKKGQLNLSSIDSYYMFQQATQAFGICGIGWGYEILSEEYREGVEIINTNSESEKYTLGQTIGNEINHILKLRLWFKQDGQTGEVFQYGVTRAVYGSKWGVTTDEEAPKKSLTDAIKKCLSMLGFCADVYMGRFEDASYMVGARAKTEIEKQESTNEAIEKAKSNIADWVTKEIESCKKIPSKNINGFKAAMNGVRKKLITKCAAANINNQNWVKKLDAVTTEELSEREPVKE